MLTKAVFLLVFSLVLLPAAPATAQTAADEELRTGAVEAYLYLYPLISMDITRRVATNAPEGAKPGFGPVNVFHHLRQFPTAEFRAVVRPNFDTLYSSAWLDLTHGPVLITVPDTGGRYYMLPLVDMWTDVFAVPGKRTSGTNAATFAVVPPGWKGKLLTGVPRIEAPTPYVWIIGRTQTNGPKDYEAVHRIQAGYAIRPLSPLGKSAPPFKPDPTVDMKTEPKIQADTMPASRFFAYGAELMKVNPPHLTDWSILARMKRLGIEPGKSFDIEKVSPEIRAALESAPALAQTQMKRMRATVARVLNGWSMNTETVGVYGNYYLKRALIAMDGLGANPPEDAIYPLCLRDADGNPLDGSNSYVLHFSKEELPPVNAFWSITMYDGEGFQAANPLDRFALGDRDNLKYNADGSLDIYIQNATPGPEKESNWLPCPKGPLGVTMRLYAPKPEALDYRWAPPAVKRVK